MSHTSTVHPPHAARRARRRSPRRPRVRGQSTAEYALVMLGASTIGLAFVAWAGGSGRIADLFDAVLDTVTGGL